MARFGPKHFWLTVLLSPRLYRLITHKVKVTQGLCHSVPCGPEVTTHLGLSSTPQPHNTRDSLPGAPPRVGVVSRNKRNLAGAPPLHDGPLRSTIAINHCKSTMILLRVLSFFFFFVIYLGREILICSSFRFVKVSFYLQKIISVFWWKARRKKA